jgi:predicted membrane protein
MLDNSSGRPTPQLIFGLLIIFLGLLFTLDNLEIIQVHNLFRFWPLILMAVGLAKFFESNRASSMAAAALFFGLGSLFLLRNLHFIPFSLWHLWPLILVFAGGSILWQAWTRDRTFTGDSESTIMALAILSGVHRTFNSQDFRGGDLTAVMGGCEIDLRDAKITDSQAAINVFAMWGGIEIRVPEDWLVVVQGIPLLGGFEDKTRLRKSSDSSQARPETAAKRLVIHGLVIMGGVEIRN